ncbi:MAG: hypothetical protein ACK549_13580, partial [Cyanobacteriota bacterium]
EGLNAGLDDCKTISMLFRCKPIQLTDNTPKQRSAFKRFDKKMSAVSALPADSQMQHCAAPIHDTPGSKI